MSRVIAFYIQIYPNVFIEADVLHTLVLIAKRGRAALLHDERQTHWSQVCLVLCIHSLCRALSPCTGYNYCDFRLILHVNHSVQHYIITIVNFD